MATRSGVLITADDLMRRIAAGEQVTLLDVRWQLAQPDGYAAYLQEHLPGAVYVSLEDELSDHTVAGRGRHPLPSGPAVQAAARRWGVRDDRPVVVYDDWNRAARRGRGGCFAPPDCPTSAYSTADWPPGRRPAGRSRAGRSSPEPGTVTVRHDDLYAAAMPTLTAEQVNEAPLLDARAPERFRGEVEPVDPVAGHIPGARNLPSTSLLAGDGTFLPDPDWSRC